MKKMRLDRYLAECGIGTRSEVKNLIKKGRVEINGKAAKDPSAKVTIPDDAVCFDGRQLLYEEFRYFMLNKPQACVSATRDGLSSTVLDILAEENTRDLFPVGRLDKDTEGLLLITNDGQLGHNLLSPKKHVYKTYIAAVSDTLNMSEMELFKTGLDIGDDEPTLPAEIEELFSGEYYDEAIKKSEHSDNTPDCECINCEQCMNVNGSSAVYKVIIREGRYHQIKRMFEVLGSEVIFLKRVSMGTLQLDACLAPGEYRRLTDEEVRALTRETAR